MLKSHYKNSRQITSQKHINNLITTFTTELILKKNMLQKNLKQQTELNVWPENHPT